jgi:hypothetical protein
VIRWFGEKSAAPRHVLWSQTGRNIARSAAIHFTAEAVFGLFAALGCPAKAGYGQGFGRGAGKSQARPG